MHLEILDPARLSLLRTICGKIDLSDFYLAGGTGLSLQMKLRKSFDFDFFTRKQFNENSLYGLLLSLFPEKTEISILNKGTCSLILNDIQVSFFEYPYPLIEEPVLCEEIPNLKLAGISDIAAMKMSAIGGRGAKKDFFDLYQILTKTGLSSGKLIDYLRIKFGANYNFSYMLMGLDYFEDAEQETLQEIYTEFNWDRAKKYFVLKKQELTDLFRVNFSSRLE